jgi:hypothetical protein
MTSRKKAPRKEKKALDRFSPKRGPGRPPRVSASAIRGRADNYRVALTRVWTELEPFLLGGPTLDDVRKGFEVALTGGTEFPQHAELILKIVTDSKFPKRRKARIHFLADSLAGLGSVTPRSSRDICARERARVKRTTYILRYEVYLECSCGYKGRSENLACRHCGASIHNPLGFQTLF